MMIKAIIFDMDGLMINSEVITREAYQTIMGQLGYTITDEFYLSLLGKPAKAIMQCFHDVYGDDFPIESIIKQVYNYLADYFETKGVPLKPGLLELLHYLKEHHIKTIVATSSNRHRVDTILAQAKLTSYFDDSICGDEVTKGKPNPEIFLKACDKLNVLPSEAIVLEDSEAGIQAAYDGGMKVICIPDMKYPSEAIQSKATSILPSLHNVIDILPNYIEGVI